MVLFSRGEVIMAPIIQFRFYYTLAGLVALGVILLLIRLTTRSVGRSVAEISAATARVEKGDYTVKLPEERSDEMGQLNRSFNHMIEGLKQRDLIEQTFGRYVDKSVAEELMSKPEALRLGGEKKTVTIMMSDLRNFTAISEKLQPEEVIKMLNRYFARMIAVIECYRGIIVDFYGDSILVFFNGMESDIALNALGAVKCALEMQQEHEGFVKENVAQGLACGHNGHRDSHGRSHRGQHWDRNSSEIRDSRIRREPDRPYSGRCRGRKSGNFGKDL